MHIDNQDATPIPAEPFRFNPETDELEYITRNKIGEVVKVNRICRHIDGLWSVKTDADGWGYAVQFRNPAGDAVRLAFPASKVYRHTTLTKRFAENGLDVMPGQAKRFCQFVIECGERAPLLHMGSFKA